MESYMSLENVSNLFINYKTGILATSLLSGLLILVKHYFNGGYFHDNSTRLDGKTVIITGSNTGIGKETALDLAKRGARVILACRDLIKAQKAADFIIKTSGNGNVIVEELDLSSLESVKKFAERINLQEDRIDILINNAGIMACPKWKSKDGFEMQFATNHLGHFFLTDLLLNKIKKSSPSRIINLSSLAYKGARMNWEDINSDNYYDPWKAYGQSKLCNILFTRELSRRLENTRVTVNALHPGIVKSELGRNIGWKMKFFGTFLLPVFAFVLKSVHQGAQTNIYCAVSPELNQVTGCYFSDCKEQKLLPHALDEKDAKRLWEISEKFCASSKN